MRSWFAVLTASLYFLGATPVALAQGFGFWGGAAYQIPVVDPPVSLVAPVIDASALANGSGGPVAVSNGSWLNCNSCSYSYQWYSQTPGTPATSGLISQSSIAGATAASYTPVACASSCPLLGVVVTATNTAGTTYSIPVALVGPLPATQSGIPINTTAPTVPSEGQGYAVGLQTLTATNGAWSNSPIGYTYQWSDSASSTCSSPTAISGATQIVYFPQTTDMGSYVCVTVTAYNSQGASSPVTSTAGALIPNSTANPVAGAQTLAITGTPIVGQILTVPAASQACNNSGAYHYFVYGANFPPLCAYQWFDWNGTTATPISGATSPDYTVQTPDIGYEIEASVTGYNNFGSLALTSAPTATVTTPSGVPVNTALDTIYSKVSGSICVNTATWIVGCQLFVTLGTWTNTPLLYDYQWLRDGSPISGATTYFYNLAAADQGHAISLQVVAQNNVGGSATETTAATGTVSESGVPVNSAIPTITGNPVQGGLLTASTGTWTLFPTSYAYQWKRNGTNISGATNATYTLVSADTGNPITVAVLATNSVGPAGSAAVSSATANVTNPGGLVAGCTASISGTAEAGATLTASLSSCSPAATSETYAWSSGGSPVGSNASTYVLAESDVGNTITVSITPSNAVGTTPPFNSSPTATITNPPAPSGGSVTATTNSPLVSQPAAWSNSGWSSVGTITYTYETCVQSTTYTGTCTGTLAGWPAQTYVPSSSDVGKNLTYIVIAANLGGSTQAYATASSAVANPAASTNSVAPLIVGTAEVGNDLVSTIGSWTSVQTQFTFQWCSSGVAHTSACPTGYGPISGATKQVYPLQSSDQGNTIIVAVTAVNPTGNVTANSAATGAVTAFPYTSGACGGWASSTFYDGCAHAPPSGPYTIQHANFFSGYAPRNGQVYPSGYGCKGELNCHPPWAVAGVDYPVGVSCGSSCGFNAPGTATDPLSGSANFNGGNPAGCAQATNTNSNWTASWAGGIATYKFTGTSPSFFYIGGKVVISGFSPSGYNGTFLNPPIPPGGNNELNTNQTFTVPMASNPGTFVSAGTIVGYENHIACNGTTSATVDIGPVDFSGAGNPNGQALSLTIGTGASGPCIIHDSLLYYDTKQTVQAGGLAANTFLGCSYVLLRNNTFIVRDTSGYQSPQSPALWNENAEVWVSAGEASAGPQTLNVPFIQQYNAFVSCPARCSSFAGMIESRFNYVDGVNSYTTTGNGAHGDGIDTSIYDGPIGFHIPCYCTGGDILSEKFDTWLANGSPNQTGSAGAIDCVTCGLINVPEGTMYGWTSGDGIFHAVDVNDLYGQFPAVNTTLGNASIITQCQDGAGNVGCNLKQANSCSIASPCQYTLNVPLAACPIYNANPGTLCSFSYIFPATIDTADIRNDIYVSNPNNANGSAGAGQAVSFPTAPVHANVGVFYGNYNHFIVKNNYLDMCATNQASGGGSWNTGFPAFQCLSPPVVQLASGATPAVSLGTGIGGNVFATLSYSPNTPVQGDNVMMNNGGCLLAFGSLQGAGFNPNPLTDCATTAPP